MRMYRPTIALSKKRRPIYYEQMLRKKDPLQVRHSEEELMKKRFVRNREDAKFTAEAERSFRRHKMKNLTSGDRFIEAMFNEEIEEAEEDDESMADFRREMEQNSKRIQEKSMRSFASMTSMIDKSEELESEALLSQGIDPLKDHKKIAELMGEDDEYFEKLEKTGWTKRSLEPGTDFSMVNPNMADIKPEEYKASVHTPSIFDLPEDADKKKNLEFFDDADIKKFTEHDDPNDFDIEIHGAIKSRLQQMKRKEDHKRSPKSFKRDYSDEESDMEVRLSKHQKDLEKSNQLQQNLIDMEITKKDDTEFKELLERENIIDPEKDFDDPSKRIVGREHKKVISIDVTSNSDIDDPILGKVYSQLDYMTKEFNLTPAERKQWFYRIRREEKELDRQQKIQAKINAKKKIKKLVKKLKIPQMKQLDMIEDYYERQGEEKKEIPSHFESYKELEFYNDDIDFMMHHKRTKKNMISVLEDYIVNSNKQSVQFGIKEGYILTLSEVRLNKACSLLHVWWKVNIIDTPLQPKTYGIQNTKLFTGQLKEDKIAKIQEKLTKASGYFRAKICQELGLRYAPELRFYHDNSDEMKTQIQEEGYEPISSMKYDENNYVKYFRELESFINLSKLEVEEYITININNESEAETLRKLHEDKDIQKEFKKSMRENMKKKHETLQKMRSSGEKESNLFIHGDVNDPNLTHQERKQLRQQRKVYHKQFQVLGEDWDQKMFSDSPKSMADLRVESESILANMDLTTPKMNPVIDQETGEKLRPRSQYRDKQGKKGRWRNKRKNRNEKFWDDIMASSM
ncbi:unnamed protein product [Moneuplotes crassus]|uniref:Uncharacterized protein n=1 Tax=Euplotes crassus TaxID=5936 RepID=A0AAD1XYQ1_EUPCR|nr:unnamed protein product [Moneuplotes crassus]